MLTIRRRPDKECKAYDLDDLQRVVDNLPVAEDRDWKTWIPLIGMLSGLRREEICQFYPFDIRQVGNVWCFDVNSNGDDKSLKTESSDRLVPIHSALIRLGFIRFVETRKDSHNLWGFKKWQTQWGKVFGNWYSGSFNRKYISHDINVKYDLLYQNTPMNRTTAKVSVGLIKYIYFIIIRYGVKEGGAYSNFDNALLTLAAHC